MLFKNNMNDECLRVLRLVGSSRRGRQELPKEQHSLYNKLPVSEAKKRDLISLCAAGVIPKTYHVFCQDLPASSAADNKLPEPDVKDTESDTD